MNDRVTEVFRNEEWIKVPDLNFLKIGDCFRMFEPDGEPVENNGETIFFAISEPYWNDTYNQWSIDIGNILQ